MDKLLPDPMCDNVCPGTGGGSTECTPAYPWNVFCSFSRACEMDGDVGGGSIGREISSMCGRDELESKMADLVVDARERSRR